MWDTIKTSLKVGAFLGTGIGVMKITEMLVTDASEKRAHEALKSRFATWNAQQASK